MIEMLSGTLRERGRCVLSTPVAREWREREREWLELTRVNPFFSNEKPGRRSQSSPSGDFGKLISKSLERAKGWRASFIPVFCLVSDAAFQSNI